MFQDLIPPKYRKWVYAIAALLSFGYGVWKASDGDWEQVIAALAGSLVAGLAHGNVHPPEDSQ